MKFSTTEFCFSFDPNREATGLPMWIENNLEGRDF